MMKKVSQVEVIGKKEGWHWRKSQRDGIKKRVGVNGIPQTDKMWRKEFERKNRVAEGEEESQGFLPKTKKNEESSLLKKQEMKLTNKDLQFAC